MILVIRKYLGLCVAAVSSVWGTTHELTVQSPNGKKRLTSPGVVAIVLTILGLAVSILFEDLQRRRTAIEQSQNLAAEAQRTNRIIISAQPLTSLTLSLWFRSGDEELRKEILAGADASIKNSENVQGGSPPVRLDAMEYYADIIPLLKYLARLGPDLGKDHKSHGVEDGTQTHRNSIAAIIPLDDARNTVLSFGYIDGEAEPEGSDGSAKLSAGFAPINDYSGLGTTRRGKSWPWGGFASGDTTSSTYELGWKLDPVTLKNSMDQAVQDIHATAKFPRVLKIAIFYDAGPLPFEKNNFALSSAEGLWSDEEWILNKTDKPVPDMELTLSVNGFDEIAYKYKLDQVHDVRLQDEYDDPFDARCTMLKFVAAEPCQQNCQQPAMKK